jgi:hypothetical protein
MPMSCWNWRTADRPRGADALPWAPANDGGSHIQSRMQFQAHKIVPVAEGQPMDNIVSLRPTAFSPYDVRQILKGFDAACTTLNVPKRDQRSACVSLWRDSSPVEAKKSAGLG